MRAVAVLWALRWAHSTTAACFQTAAQTVDGVEALKFEDAPKMLEEMTPEKMGKYVEAGCVFWHAVHGPSLVFLEDQLHGSICNFYIDKSHIYLSRHARDHPL